MKKKILIIIGILSIFIGIIFGIITKNVETEIVKDSEYIPEVEITDEELRKTIVTLYFYNKKDNKLGTEARLIDSKELLRDTYKVLLKMLIEGPKNNDLTRLLPDNIKIIDTQLKGDCLIVNLSKEFLKIDKTDSFKVSNIIYSIVNTLTELKEVSKVKFLIEGEESNYFDDIGVDLKSEFTRIK